MGINNYLSFLDSVPEGWDLVRFQDVCELQRGFDLPKKNRVIGKYPLVSSNGATDLISEYRVKGPGVVTGRSGTLGKFFYTEDNFWPLNTVLWVKDFKGNNKKYIYYLLSTLNFQEFNAGSGVPTLNRNHLDLITVLLPSVEKQKQIAEILSSLDDKIELNRKINANLENMASALFKKWFVDIGDELPEGWRMGRVSDLIRVESGFAFTSGLFKEFGQYKLVTIKNVQDGHFVTECTNALSVVPNNMPQHCLLKDGDILLSLTGNVGRICLVHGQNYLLNQRVATLAPINESDRAFTYFLFRQKDLQDMLISMSHGSAQQNLSPIETKALGIIIPSTEALDQYAKIANPIFQMLVENHKENMSLSVLRDSLLPRLMNGKIRVN